MLIKSVNHWNQTLRVYINLNPNDYTADDYNLLVNLPPNTSIFEYGLNVGNELLRIRLYSELISLRDLGKDVIGIAYTFGELVNIFPIIETEYMKLDISYIFGQLVGVSPIGTVDPFLSRVFELVVNLGIAGIIDLLVGKVYSMITGGRMRPAFSLVTTRWLLSQYPPLAITVRLLVDTLIVLVTEGIFSMIAYLFVTVIPKILALLLVFVLDTLFFFLYALPFGIGSAIKQFRDDLFAWASGTIETSNNFRIQTYEFVGMLGVILTGEFLLGVSNKNVLMITMLSVLCLTDALITIKEA